MCRHLAYLGPPRDLATLLLDPPHSLLRQSYAPADMRGSGTVNADGFGVGWYPDGVTTPIRYRRAVPIWTDAAFAALARDVRSGAVLAAVRSATVGMPIVDTACAPFATGRWLFSHNGVVAGWPHSVAAPAGRLPVTDLLTLDASTDSALLWALVRHRLAAGASLGGALGAVTAQVQACAPGSRLNLLVTDGTELAATAVHHALAVRVVDGGVLVCSEPTDQSPDWEPVPDCHLLTATPSTVDVAPIPVTTAEEP
ncbi:MAG: ergothioneine biosynthesis protein EgtC [Pseudonocardiales bacterium]|nr:ergothioneine biosynthesis protein EgtC [Pseudonocardiales bacterium]MBV9031268.1 ergothioneine biosynthesis protein EgtC [Pseudonocardiales bacterium]